MSTGSRFHGAAWTIHEYDGGDHLERLQQRRDLRRGRRLVDADLERRGYTAVDVLSQGIAILRDADRATGRSHDPARIRVWHELLRGSLLTPAGTAAFCERFGIPLPGAGGAAKGKTGGSGA